MNGGIAHNAFPFRDGGRNKDNAIACLCELAVAIVAECFSGLCWCSGYGYDDKTVVIISLKFTMMLE